MDKTVQPIPFYFVNKPNKNYINLPPQCGRMDDPIGISLNNKSTKKNTITKKIKYTIFKIMGKS